MEKITSIADALCVVVSYKPSNSVCTKFWVNQTGLSKIQKSQSVIKPSKYLVNDSESVSFINTNFPQTGMPLICI